MVTLFDRRGERTPLPKMSKRDVADRILDRMGEMWAEAP